MTARSPDIDALIACFQTLTPASVAQVTTFYADDARFRDPFNDVRGVAAIARIFAHMFEQVGQPVFTVTEVFRGERALMLVWYFEFLLGQRSLRVEGVSRMRFNDDGLIVEHDDFWDPASGLYVHFPVLGALQRWLRRRLAAPA